MNAAPKEAVSIVQSLQQQKQQQQHQQQSQTNTNAHQNAIENVDTNGNENQNKTENRTAKVQNFNETKITITPPTLIPPTVAAATAACVAAAVHVNEETEKAAMMMEGDSANRGVDYDATTTTTTTKTMMLQKATATPPPHTTRVAATQGKTTVEAQEFVVPATPTVADATKVVAGGGGGGGGSGSSSGLGVKKKRTKSAKKRGEESEIRLSAGSGVHHKHRKDIGARNAATTLTVGVAGGSATGVAGAGGMDAATAATSMKTSISMTSLPPDDEKSERRDVIKAKLQVERPYNSLKKNIERNVVGATLAVMPYGGSGAYSHHSNSSSSFANHRYSWGSGYSYSSSSLHSNATLGLGSAKDDLWAAIQTNYNYIMDTNLLDTCRETERHLAEAHCNIGGGAVDSESTCLKLLGVTQRREMLWHDPKELRKWLREMEERLERAPTVSVATALSTTELERCLAEHSVLYHEIVSHARVVSACIRVATEKIEQEELLQRQQQQQQQQHQQLEDEQQLNSLSSCATLAEHNNLSLSSNEEAIIDLTATTATAVTELETEPHISSRNSNSNTNSSSSSGIETATNINTTVESKSNTSEFKDTSPRSSASSHSGSACATDSGNQSVEGNLERLQNRYHLLYLKAFEVQLWLDGLLRKRVSNTSIVDCGADYVDDVEGDSSECDNNDDDVDVDVDDDDDDDDDEDEDDENAAEAAATEDDFNGVGSGLESDVTHNSSSLCDLQSYNQHFSDTVKHNSSRRIKGDCEDGDDEEEDEDEVDYGAADHVWPRPTYSAVLVTYDKHGNTDNPTAATTLTDFEADSESSDWEVTPHNRNKGYMSSCSSPTQAITATPTTPSYNEPTASTPTLSIAERNIIVGAQATNDYVDVVVATVAADSDVLATDQTRAPDTTDTATTSMKVKMNELNIVGGDILSLATTTPMSPANANATTALATTTTTTTSTATQTQQQKLQTLHGNSNQLTTTATAIATPTVRQKSIAVISPNNSHNSHNSNQKSPTVLRKHRQQQHYNDISKFNRSNRKSKNCAIFYFKHLDTDNETNCSSAGDLGDAQTDAMPPDGLSSSASQTSEHLLKSADASSDDDEGWQYSSVVASSIQKHEVIGENCRSISSNLNNNNNNNNNNKSSNCITAIVLDGIQSSTVSSSTTVTKAISINGDDSDKENTTTHTTATIALQGIVNAATTLTLSSALPSSTNSTTQISHAEIQLAAVPTTKAKSTVQTFVANTNVASGSASASGSGSSQSSSSYSTRSSSCSSNDLLTETTSATTATQITQMHFQRMHRTEMELQINGGGCYNNNSQQVTDVDSYGNGNGNGSGNGSGDVNGNGNGKSNIKTPHIKANNNNSNNNINNIASTTMHNNNRNCGNNNNHCSDNASHTNNNNNNNNYNQHLCNNVVRNAQQHQQQQQQQLDATNGNVQKLHNQMYFHTRADICNITGRPTSNSATNKCLPPRTPHKSHKSTELSSALQRNGRGSGSATTSTRSPTKAKLSHESIKQLVLEAEHLVRDSEALKTPAKQKQKHSMVKLSSTVKKREVIMPGPIKQRVQEWLEHQPVTPLQLHKSSPEMLLLTSTNSNGNARTDDCEASGEASETDSVPQHSSDTSEGFTDSIATCMQTSTNSYGGNSTERIGGSAEPIISPTTVLGYGSSNQSLNDKIVKRTQSRRKSERPWSVSCLSQLTTETVQTATAVTKVSNVQGGLATHSISESALDSLSPGRQRACSSSTPHHVAQVKTSTSKGSLKRRKTRKKKSASGANLSTVTAATYSAGKKTPDTGSEETAELPRLTQTLLMKSCESMSAQQIQEVTSALLSLQRNAVIPAMEQSKTSDGTIVQHAMSMQQQQSELHESSEEGQLMKPNFRVGSYTTAYMRNEKRLGSLAALATYRNDEDEEQQGEYTTGTEDHHSSFSETAWDNYQEKYNSENYSEGFDSDAARRLMEFGDDYRNFIDSQSDCCSSLSAANNLDSLSPPRMNSLQQNEVKAITQDTIVTSVDHARRRRALDLEYERGRKTLETRRKSCQDCTEVQNPRNSGISLSSSANALTPKNGAEKTHQQQYKVESANRKLEFGMHHSAQSLRRTSESDTSTRRRKVDERRRSSRNLDKSIKLIPATSSSSCDDSDDEKEMRNLLHQSRNRLEDTRALKIRCHLLRPEDYTEIINTCRDNIRCLEAVLRGPPGTVLSAQCASQTKDLLAAWEDLLGWSENAAAARKMQEEMIILKHSLNRLGNKATFELLDTEPQIQIAIESLKNEKSQLQNYRTNMLRLNASVHSWLTRQERRLQNALNEQEELKQAEAANQEQQQVSIPEQKTQAAVQEKIVSVTSTTKIVTDNNGNTMETQTVESGVNTTTANTNTATAVSNSSVGSKVWDLNTLINSENEFHKHLKDEVSDMYSAWDEADARISTQLEMLTSSLIAWRQLECGLYELQQALGQDRGTLKGLEGALDKGQTTPVELAQNVKVVAKLLSERVHVSQEQLTAVQEHLDPNHILHIAKFTASNGSLSDSGISDGGATSDGGLSERERRLGVLRRLVKQLESALAPGSEAMKSIAARMESAEAELKNLQNTCRDLIVRTAATHQHKKLQQQKQQQQQTQQTELEQLKEMEDGNALLLHKSNGDTRINGHAGGVGNKKTNKQNQSQQLTAASPKRKNRRKQRKYSAGSNAEADASMLCTNLERTGVATNKAVRLTAVVAPDSGDPSDDPSLEFDLDSSDDDGAKSTRNSWAWRIAKAAVPVQLALFTFLCAACLMQPNCCDNINNLSMSFTPQLRYIRGPPPI